MDKISENNARILEEKGINLKRIKPENRLTIAEEAAQVNAEIQQETVSSISLFQKILRVIGVFVAGYLILVAVISVLFFRNPAQTSDFFGYYYRYNNIGESQTPTSMAEGNNVLAAATGPADIAYSTSILADVLKPAAIASLVAVKAIDDSKYTQIVVNPVLTAVTGAVQTTLPGLPGVDGERGLTGATGPTGTDGISIALSNVGTAGTYGSATQVPVLTTDAQGRITGVTNTTITLTEADTLAIVTGRGAITATALTLSNIANAITVGTLTASGGTINGITIGASSPTTGVFTTVNGLTITNNGTNTLAIATGKTLTVNNSITFDGTDGTTLTLPSSTDTLVGRTSTDTLTNKTIASGVNTISGLTNSNLSGTAGITNANLANSSATVTAGTGLSGGGAVSLGGLISLTNTGVTSLTGTTNQVNVSASTGAITLTLPQNIHSGASPTFAGLTLSTPTATANYGTINIGDGAFDGTTSGFFTGDSDGTQLAVNAISGYTGDLANFQVAGANKLKITADGHLGIGTTPNINQPLIITKTFTDGTTAHNAFTLTLDSTIGGTGVSQVRGQNIAVKNSATTTGTGVLSGSLYTMQGNGSQNYLTNNFTGISISMTTLSGQSGTIVDTNAIRLNAPSFAGSKPTSAFGLQIFNQGVSGVTTSAALKIAAQSGSTNNYGLIIGGGSNGFGTLTPLEVVDITGNLQLNTIGNLIKIKEGTNASMGVATLVAGTVTVSNTLVTANSRTFLTGQNSSGTAGELTISARTAGTSFTITSTSALDTRDVAWHIIEPAP